jgi:hypothetical protein
MAPIASACPMPAAVLLRTAREGGGSMRETELDEFGPVNYLVVEFPAGKSEFTGGMGSALTDLVERGLVRVLDLLIVRKNDDGSFDAFELPDLDESEIGELRAFERDVAELLSEDDVAAIVEAMEPRPFRWRCGSVRR